MELRYELFFNLPSASRPVRHIVDDDVRRDGIRRGVERPDVQVVDVRDARNVGDRLTDLFETHVPGHALHHDMNDVAQEPHAARENEHADERG